LLAPLLDKHPLDDISYVQLQDLHIHAAFEAFKPSFLRPSHTQHNKHASP
jgi:hypothetical protein